MQTTDSTTFRQSMNALHTWSGVVLGSLLFAIVWMGTLCLLAVLLNALTTPHHLGASLGQHLWAVAGMDLLILLAGSFARVTARKLAVNGGLVITKPQRARAQTLQNASSHA